MASAKARTYQIPRDGTSQFRRILPMLSPDSVKIEGRSNEELVAYAYQYAKELKFFTLKDEAQGDWQPFWETYTQNSLKALEKRQDNSPHFALFLCFLELYRSLAKDINSLTEKHLAFYYEKVLHLQPKGPEADQIHVIFELAKQASHQLVKKGHVLDAGRDENKNLLEYETEADIIVNKAKIAHLYSLYKSNEGIKFATMANSLDGMGKEFEEAPGTWSMFGHKALPNAEVGFAIASPLLWMAEGTRTISLTLHMVSPSNEISADAASGFEVWLSGEKGWLGPYFGKNASSEQSGNTYALSFDIEVPPTEEAISYYDSETLGGGFQVENPMMRLMYKQGADSGMYTQLSAARLSKLSLKVDVKGIRNLALENDFGSLNASKPFMPFGSQPKVSSNFYIGSEEALGKSLSHMKLKFSWQAPPKSFATHYQAYGSHASGLSNASFTVSVKGLKAGEWDDAVRSVKIFDSSDARKEHTLDLSETGGSGTSGEKATIAFPFLRLGSQALTSSISKIYDPFATSELFAQAKSEPKTPSAQKIQLTGREKEGFLRMSLERDFLHAEFPNLYTLAMIDQTLIASGEKPASEPSASLAAKTTGLQAEIKQTGIKGELQQQSLVQVPFDPIPKPPYTPVMAEIVMNYTSQVAHLDFPDPNSLKTDSATASIPSSEGKKLRFFHITPFGQAEQDSFLKSDLGFAGDTRLRLLPHFPHTGEFYIGLENAKALQTVNILFQLVEGSADPGMLPPNIEWSILSKNEWRKLGNQEVLSDDTNQLLTTGIIKFYLPSEARDDNTLLKKGFMWLRGVPISKDHNELGDITQAVSLAQSLHAQAIKARYKNLDTNPGHLATALQAERIKKLVPKLPNIKSAVQPNASFGGTVGESNTHFFKRISERLRHKGRAVSTWDYEHLVLEHFPSIYKAKCLVHTKVKGGEFCFSSPGGVAMIVVPDLRNRLASNLLEPKVDLNTLSLIKEFLALRSSGFVDISVKNPVYEKVKLELAVSFHTGYEFGFYQQELNNALISYLSPWARDVNAEITFGGILYKSHLVRFMEELPYVDYVSNVQMFHLTESRLDSTSGATDLAEVPSVVATEKEAITASHPAAILVSNESHIIQNIES